jgi:hypothetical protein
MQGDMELDGATVLPESIPTIPKKSVRRGRPAPLTLMGAK